MLAVQGVLALDIGIPVQVFDTDPHYRVTVCAERGGDLVNSTGFRLDVDAGLEAMQSADTIVVPGFAPPERSLAPELLDALRTAHRRGCRMVSICVGAFALAAAGLLDGRRACTHWRDAGRLQRAYPAVRVDPAPLFIDEGDVLTSAGVAAGIDLCLHLIAKDHGAAAANVRARGIIAAPRREGGQAQFIERFLPESRAEGLAATRAWLLDNLAAPVTIDAMAAHAGCSRRTFLRHFQQETGLSPLAWLTAARIDRAREILETTDVAVERIGEYAGLGSPANTRMLFRRHVGVAPATYRRTYRPST